MFCVEQGIGYKLGTLLTDKEIFDIEKLLVVELIMCNLRYLDNKNTKPTLSLLRESNFLSNGRYMETFIDLFDTNRGRK